MSNVCVEAFNFKKVITSYFRYCFWLYVRNFEMEYLIVVSDNLHRLLHVASDILHRTPLIPINTNLLILKFFWALGNYWLITLKKHTLKINLICLIKCCNFLVWLNFKKSLVTCKWSINIHVMSKIIFSFKYKKVGAWCSTCIFIVFDHYSNS
jgi:hypothetical protein